MDARSAASLRAIARAAIDGARISRRSTMSVCAFSEARLAGAMAHARRRPAWHSIW